MDVLTDLFILAGIFFFVMVAILSVLLLIPAERKRPDHSIRAREFSNWREAERYGTRYHAHDKHDINKHNKGDLK